MARRATRRRSHPVADFLRRLIFTGMVLGTLAAAAAGVIVYREITSSLPPIDRVVEYRPPVVTQVFAHDGTLIAELFSEKRYLVPIDRIPAVVRHAFIAAEDDGFYQHRGVDPVSVVRALLNNVVAGGKVQGGSTITQQVVKLLVLSPKKSYERKLKEFVLALRLEQQLSKDEILSLYLNHLYLGSGAHGVAAAAREYFGKDVEDLNLAEAALLAGLPQAPSRYSPFRNWPEAKARQQYVLQRMKEARFINREAYEAALRYPVRLATRKGNFLAAPHFVEHVRRTLEERYGQTALYELGLRVRTAVDLDLQRTAEAALRRGIDALVARHGGYRGSFRAMEGPQREAYLRQQRQLIGGAAALHPTDSYEAIVTAVRPQGARVQVGQVSGELVFDGNGGGAPPALQPNDLIRVRFVEANGQGARFAFDPTPVLEGALVALEPGTGYVRAMVGGYDFDRSQFNRVVQAKRQPGSAFKPLIYAAALDRGFTPASVVVDEPISFNDNGRVWSPHNFEQKFFGPTTLRDALTFSRNVVTVKITQRMGVKYLVDYLGRFGLRGPFAPNLSLALGSAEVTPLELAVAYATFATGGQRPRPRFITEITDFQGNVLERNEPDLTPAIPPSTAFHITSMLQDVILRGTGRRAAGLAHPVAGKTGTTNEFHDNWFVGYSPQLLTAVWLGFDNKRPLGDKETGGRNAAPIWRTVMEHALGARPVADFPVPGDLSCVHIDPATGTRAVPGGASRLECFPRGGEPQPAAPVSPPPAVQPVVDPRPGAPSVADFLRNDF
jgi:penicillin-binding protein 1A